jgi:putative flippase GtrA
MRKELMRFLVVGLTTVGIDYVTYQILLTLAVVPAQAKAAGFIAGTIFAYFANRFWTFGSKNAQASLASMARFALLYSSTLACNVGANSAMLTLLVACPYRLQSAFIVATGISATLNFLGMKYLVFKQAPVMVRP